MPREYRHIQQYENEMLELRAKGLTYLEIAEKFGLKQIKVKKFFERYRIKERKMAAGITIQRRGRPRKNGDDMPPSVEQLSKLAQLQYELSRKDRYIKSLEMENELMRDFLSLTGRK